MHATISAVIAAGLLALSSGALAQAGAADFPNRAVRIVVGQTPGASPDLVARAFAGELTRHWGVPVVVENRSGAGGTIAAELVARSPADGYTLLIGGQSALVTPAAAGRAMRYDPLVDLTPIGGLVDVPGFIAAGAHLPVSTIAELVALAKAEPGRLTFGSFGDATVSQAAFLLLQQATGIELTEVPYRGASQATVDLLAGRVDLLLKDVGSGRQLAEEGRLRPLGVTMPTRSAFAPDLPTIAEQGVRGYAVTLWYGLLAPAGLPADVHASLAHATSVVRRSAAFRLRLADLRFETVDDTPAQFAAQIRADIDRLKRSARPARPSPRAPE